MEYKKTLHKIKDDKNRKGNKLCVVLLDFLFLTKKNIVSHNEDYFCQGHL